MTTIKQKIDINPTQRFIKNLCLSCITLAVFVGLSNMAFAEDFPELNLKFGHPYNETHPLSLGAQRFADTVNERSGGKITLQVYPNGTIGSSKKLVEAMQINVVDIALVPTTNVASFYDPLNIFYLPFLF
jgi:TRAP-type C4-dicarboxylate transport system substrate-binding protein